jgi:hypothetical protein
VSLPSPAIQRIAAGAAGTRRLDQPIAHRRASIVIHRRGSGSRIGAAVGPNEIARSAEPGAMISSYPRKVVVQIRHREDPCQRDLRMASARQNPSRTLRATSPSGRSSIKTRPGSKRISSSPSRPIACMPLWRDGCMHWRRGSPRAASSRSSRRDWIWRPPSRAYPTPNQRLRNFCTLNARVCARVTTKIPNARVCARETTKIPGLEPCWENFDLYLRGRHAPHRKASIRFR